MDPKNGNYPYSKALCFQKMNDVPKALAMLDQAVKLDNTHVQAYALQARLRLKQKDAVGAAASFDYAFKHENEDKDKKLDYKIQALKYYTKTNEFAKAATSAKEGLTQFPGNIDVLYYEAVAFNGLKKYDDAIKTINDAIAKTNADAKLKSDAEFKATLYYELGFAYYNKGEFEKCEKILNDNAMVGKIKSKAIRLTPDYFYKVAYAYHNVLSYELSKEYINQAKKMKPQDFKVGKLSGDIARKEEDHTQAIAQYKAALKDDVNKQKKLQLYNDIIELEYEDKKYDAAIQTADACLKEYPNEVTTLYLKAMILYRQNKLTPALEIMDNLIRGARPATEEFMKYQFSLGLFYTKKNELQKALAAFKESRGGTFGYVAQIEAEKIHAILKDGMDDDDTPGAND